LPSAAMTPEERARDGINLWRSMDSEELDKAIERSKEYLLQSIAMFESANKNDIRIYVGYGTIDESKDIEYMLENYTPRQLHNKKISYEKERLRELNELTPEKYRENMINLYNTELRSMRVIPETPENPDPEEGRTIDQPVKDPEKINGDTSSIEGSSIKIHDSEKKPDEITPEEPGGKPELDKIKLPKVDEPTVKTENGAHTKTVLILIGLILAVSIFLVLKTRSVKK